MPTPTLRVARPTDSIAALLPFYVEGLGFTVLGGFDDHEGFDGVMLGHPGAPYYLEFTRCRGHAAGRAPTQDHLLVLYLPDAKEALPCAGFGDVDSTDLFCPSVEWLTNRGVTTGCDTYPRVATPVGALLYHAGPAGNDVATRLVYRLPPSTFWQSWSGSIARATNPAGGYTSQSPTAPALLLQAGTTIAFGIQATSGTGAALAVSVAGCELNVRIDSRTGAGTPY